MKNKSTCDRVRRLVEPFLDGELPAHERDEVKAELARCDECRAEFQRLSKLRALVREVYLEEVRTAELTDILPGVLERIEREPLGAKARFANWLERFRLGLVSPAAAMGVAGSLAVAVMAGTLVYVSTAPDNPSGPQGEPTMLSERGPMDVLSSGDDSQSDVQSEASALGNHATFAASKPNELFITYYASENGTVIIDSDPDGEAPTVLWHLTDEGVDPAGQEDGQI